MEALLPVLAGIVGLTIAAIVGLSRQRSRLRAWREAAAFTKLTEVHVVDDFLGASLEGRSDNLRIRLESYRHGRYESGTRFLVHGLGGGDLYLRREDLRTALGKSLLHVEEITTGSPEFDSAVYVQGTDPTVFAILDVETRRRFARLLQGEIVTAAAEPVRVRASVANGTLKVELAQRLFDSADLKEVLPAVLALAHRLETPRDVPRRIANNLQREPEAGVRLTALATLAREFPEHPATREALRAARSDESSEVRLRSAMALGEEGREILRNLASGGTADDACAARAVEALGGELALEDATALLGRSLDAKRGRTAVACLEALGRRGPAASQEGMLAALRGPDGAVRLAAVRALGRAGTVAAVGDLLAASERGTRELKAAVRQAVAEIQSRLEGAEPGQLSLVGDASGALSLADQEPGQLSLSEPEVIPPERPEEEAPAAKEAPAEPGTPATPLPPPRRRERT